jgi:hypothetical protein
VRNADLEYVRHGTQTVIAAFDVATGQVTASVGETSTEQDYATFLDTLFAAGASTTKWRLIADISTRMFRKAWCVWSPACANRRRPRRKGQVGREDLKGSH